MSTFIASVVATIRHQEKKPVVRQAPAANNVKKFLAAMLRSLSAAAE